MLENPRLRQFLDASSPDALAGVAALTQEKAESALADFEKDVRRVPLPDVGASEKQQRFGQPSCRCVRALASAG